MCNAHERDKSIFNIFVKNFCEICEICVRLNFFVKFVSFVIKNYQLSIINCQLNKG